MQYPAFQLLYANSSGNCSNQLPLFQLYRSISSNVQTTADHTVMCNYFHPNLRILNYPFSAIVIQYPCVWMKAIAHYCTDKSLSLQYSVRHFIIGCNAQQKPLALVLWNMREGMWDRVGIDWSETSGLSLKARNRKQKISRRGQT